MTIVSSLHWDILFDWYTAKVCVLVNVIGHRVFNTYTYFSILQSKEVVYISMRRNDEKLPPNFAIFGRVVKQV